MITLIIYRIVTLPAIIILSVVYALLTIVKWLKYGQLPQKLGVKYGSQKR